MTNKYHSPKKCLVTGGAGFIGHHLSHNLLEKGFSVLSIDNLSDYYDPKLKQSRLNDLENKLNNFKDKCSYEFVNLDIRDKKEVFKVIKDFQPDTICHLAAQAGVRYSLENPFTYVDNNITGTLTLLEASRKFNIENFVFASTSSVYGLSKDMPYSEDNCIDSIISPYASTKRAAELLCHTYHKIYGIKFRVMRFFTVYGPWGRPDMALFKFTKSIINDDPIEIYNNGQMMRDFTYISDIVSGFTAAIETPLDFEIINLGCGNPIKLLDFINILEKHLGYEAKKVMKPMQDGDVPATWADISKAKKILDYHPRINIDEGIFEFVNWYRKFYNI